MSDEGAERLKVVVGELERLHALVAALYTKRKSITPDIARALDALERQVDELLHLQSTVH